MPFDYRKVLYTKPQWWRWDKLIMVRKFSEKSNVIFRRSLCFVKDLKMDDITVVDAIRSFRPAFRLAT